MFKIAAKRSISWPVHVDTPIDGGGTKKSRFMGQFDVLSQDEQDDVVNGRHASGKTDLLDVALTGWSSLKAEDGSDVSYSDEAKAELLNLQYVRVALFRAYGQIQAGQGARKN